MKSFIDLMAKNNEEMESRLQPITSFSKQNDIMVSMRDGVQLKTRVFFPEGEGPWPVILERSPYPHMKPMQELTNKQFTKYGYVVVSQDCRGKGDSQGKWEPFENERKDGLDTIQWIIQQPWMNGKMAMYGMSYGGFEQWIVADELPSEVKTLFIGVFGTERYRQMYMNGMFRHEIYTSWAIENAGVKSDHPLGDIYQEALKKRPHIEMDELLGEKLPWYREWVTNVSAGSSFWQTGLWNRLRHIPKKIDIPLYLFGGWYDHHLDGMVCGYNGLSDLVKQKSRFVIGPWIHTLRPGGDLQYPDSEFSSLEEAIKWFNHQLKDEPYDERKGIIESYVIGENKWQVWSDGLQGKFAKKLYLRKNGLKKESALSLTNDQPFEKETISFTYDPEEPVKTKGGEALLAWISQGFNGSSPSSVLQDPPGQRDDVMTFISEELEQDLRITGSMKVGLTVSTNVEDTAFTVKVSEMCEDGKSYNIRDGITSLSYRNGATEVQTYQPGDKVDVEIELWPITWTIKKGSKVRLDVSSSNFPAYHLHPNVAGAWAEQTEVKVAHQQIHSGDGSNSYIEIPTMDEEG